MAHDENFFFSNNNNKKLFSKLSRTVYYINHLSCTDKEEVKCHFQ